MSRDYEFREPRRARRIRDRDRMRMRAMSVVKQRLPGPDSLPRDCRWTDLKGVPHVGTPDWEAVHERRRALAWPLADHLANCSCPGCGNPRRHWNARTMQEVRAAAGARCELVAEGIFAAARLPGRRA